MAHKSIHTTKEISLVSVDSLKPYPHNPRTWDDSDEKHLMESIKKFGVTIPLLVNNAPNRENIVIGGNFRLAVCKKMKIATVPVVYISLPDENEERELNLRLNKNRGTWDYELLKEYDIGELLHVGFDEIDLGRFWDNELATEDDNFDEKKALEQVKNNPIAREGDLFALGNHQVICGDCTDVEIVKRLVAESTVSYINSDPPYNIKLDYAKGVGQKAGYGGKEKDNRTDEEYKNFLKSSIQNALAVAHHDTHIFYWCDETYAGLLQQIYRELGVDNKRLCIWIKNNQNVTPQIAFNKVTEFCVYGTRGKPYINESIRNINEIQNKEISSGNRSADDIYDLLNIWLVDRLPTTEYKHPTMKSPTLYEKALRRCTKVGDFVLDMFGGSGSQLIACEQLKRQALLVEVDPVFVDLILYRYEQLTGIKPQKIS